MITFVFSTKESFSNQTVLTMFQELNNLVSKVNAEQEKIQKDQTAAKRRARVLLMKLVHEAKRLRAELNKKEGPGVTTFVVTPG